MAAATMTEIQIKVKTTGSDDVHWRAIKGVVASQNFAVTEPASGDSMFARFKLTHCGSGMAVANVHGITEGRKLARRLEKLGDWSAITEPSEVPPELAKAAAEVIGFTGW
jgi:hypothetical protein